MLECAEPLEHGKQSEVHRTHVEGCDFGLEHRRGPDAFLHGHVRRAAGGEVYHGVCGLFDARQKAGERFGGLIRLSGLGIARVQMNDGGTRFGRAYCRLGDLVRSHGQERRHGGRVNRTGDGAGDDDFVVRVHVLTFLLMHGSAQSGIIFAACCLKAASDISLLSRHACRACNWSAASALRRSVSIVSNTGPLHCGCASALVAMR